MAKISVSIPDELKEQLDTYSEQTGLKRSKALAYILESFFADYSTRPTSLNAAKLDEIDEDLDEVQAYLSRLHALDPEYYPQPPWVEKPKRRARSFLSRTTEEPN